MKISIVTDSTCDLPESIAQKYGITVIPLYIQQGGQTYLDGVNLTREEFYAKLPGFHPSPTTAAPSPEVFKEAWEKLAEAGANAILSIHISGKLSATINSAHIAATQFTRIPVTVLDSSQLSLGMGFIVEKAAQMAELGHEWLAEYAPYERLAIVHAGVQKEAEEMLQRIKKYLPHNDIPIVQITPALGAHLGGGAFGFAVISKEN